MRKPNRTRNKLVSVRFSPAEYERLQELVRESGQTVQSYVINATLGARIIGEAEMQEVVRQNKILADIDTQLRGMGTNINQMAHVANATGALPDEGTFKRLSEEINTIRGEVEPVWRSIRSSISQQKHTGQ